MWVWMWAEGVDGGCGCGCGCGWEMSMSMWMYWMEVQGADNLSQMLDFKVQLMACEKRQGQMQHEDEQEHTKRQKQDAAKHCSHSRGKTSDERVIMPRQERIDDRAPARVHTQCPPETFRTNRFAEGPLAIAPVDLSLQPTGEKRHGASTP